MKSSMSNTPYRQFLAKLMVLCLILGLVPTLALAMPADPPEESIPGNATYTYYTITADAYSNGRLNVEYTKPDGNWDYVVLQPGMELYALPGSKVEIVVVPETDFFIASCAYTMNGERTEMEVPETTYRMDDKIDAITGDIRFEVRFQEKISVSAASYAHGSINFTQYDKTTEVNSGQTVTKAINPQAPVDLEFTADPGYVVGSNTYYIVNDTEYHPGFDGENRTEKVTVREDKNSFGNITVVPEFVPEEVHEQFTITSTVYASQGASVAVTQFINELPVTQTLNPYEPFDVEGGSDVIITVLPDVSHYVGDGSYYTMAGRLYQFDLSYGTAMPVSATVRVTGDIEIRPSLVRVYHPADHLTYAINLAPVDEGYVHMYRTTSAQGGYIPFTITPDTGREVESVRIITFSGEDVPVRSWGEVPGYDGPLYTFYMPEDSVTILVTFKDAESNLTDGAG